jgi:hypothetical protein
VSPRRGRPPGAPPPRLGPSDTRRTMNRPRTILVTALFSAALVLNGCYTYVAAPPTLPRGTSVRVQLQAPQDIRLREVTVNGASRVDGEVVNLEPDRLTLSAFSVVTAFGGEYLAHGRTVTLSRNALARIDRKRFSVWRTAVLAAAGFGAAVLFDRVVDRIGSGGDGGGSGSGQPR